MQTNIVATIEGRTYVYARDIEAECFQSPDVQRHSAQFEIRSGMIRGRWFRVNGGKMRILMDVDDAKLMHDYNKSLIIQGITDPQERRQFTLEFFAVRAGYESFGKAWDSRKDLRRLDKGEAA